MRTDHTVTEAQATAAAAWDTAEMHHGVCLLAHGAAAAATAAAAEAATAARIAYRDTFAEGQAAPAPFTFVPRLPIPPADPAVSAWVAVRPRPATDTAGPRWDTAAVVIDAADAEALAIVTAAGWVVMPLPAAAHPDH